MLLFKRNSILSKSHRFSSIQELIVWNSWFLPIKSMGTSQVITVTAHNNPDMWIETGHLKCKDKRKHILPPGSHSPTSHLHRRQNCSFADEESIPPAWGPCHFQLAGSAVPSSVSVTGPVAPTASQHQHQSWAQRWERHLSHPATASQWDRNSTRQGKQPGQRALGPSQPGKVKCKAVLTIRGSSELLWPYWWLLMQRVLLLLWDRTLRATGHFYSFLFQQIPPEWTSLDLAGNISLEVTKALQACFWWLSVGMFNTSINSCLHKYVGFFVFFSQSLHKSAVVTSLHVFNLTWRELLMGPGVNDSAHIQESPLHNSQVHSKNLHNYKRKERIIHFLSSLS